MRVGAIHVVKNPPVRSREQSTAADGAPHQTSSSRRRYRLFLKKSLLHPELQTAFCFPELITEK